MDMVGGTSREGEDFVLLCGDSRSRNLVRIPRTIMFIGITANYNGLLGDVRY